MPGRKYKANSSSYRFGCNGKENDNDVKGEGNQIDYGMRIYDPRLGRFLSVDPLTKQYPELTPYQFASNSPIQALDLDGLEGKQYLIALKINGATVIKRVVEVDVYVAVSRKEGTAHYYSKNPESDAGVRNTVENDLKAEYRDNRFKDAQNHDVIWKFNVKSFEVDEDESINTKHVELKNDNSFKVTGEDGRTQYRGVIVQQSHLSNQKVPDEPQDLPVTEDGYLEHGFDISVNDEYYSPREQRGHTLGHEMNHFFLRMHLNAAISNPANTAAGHQGAGGGNLAYGNANISYPGTIRSSDEKPTVSMTGLRPLSQTNVTNILQSVPKTGIETVDFSKLIF